MDLIALCQEDARELAGSFIGQPGAVLVGSRRPSPKRLLGDDPIAIVGALKAAVRAGASPADLGRSLAYAAALRVARFGNANEHADWETAHHVFTYANAVHQLLKRIAGSAGRAACGAAARAVLHGAMAVYLARYLNVPAARLPGEAGEPLDDLPTDAEALGAALLDAFDRQRQVDAAARLVARHLTLGHPPQALIATLGRALLREDAGFPCLSDVRGRRETVRGMGRHRSGSAHPYRCCPLPRGSCSYREIGLADGRDRPPSDARRTASHGRRLSATRLGVIADHPVGRAAELLPWAVLPPHET